MKRRNLILASSGLLALPAWAAKPCPPPVVSTSSGDVTSPVCPAVAPGSSALATLAASMAAGTWAELVTTGINTALLSSGNGGGVGGNNIPYTNQMAWNPITKQIKLTCSDHGAAFMPELTYNESANAWSVANAGTAPSGGWPFGTHAYGHFQCRPDNGDLYSRYNGGGIMNEPAYRKPSGGAWAAITGASGSSNSYTQIGVGSVWWPGSNTGHVAPAGIGAAGCYMIFEISAGAIMVFDPLANAWSVILVPQTANDPYHTVAAYSAQFNCAVYGGGNGNKRMWRLNVDKTATELPPCPMVIGIQGSNLQVDPVTGKFVVWGGGRKMYELDPSGAGTWTLITAASRQPPAAGLHGVADPSQGAGGPDALASCSLPAHGVIAYMSASGASYANMFLYKHA